MTRLSVRSTLVRLLAPALLASTVVPSAHAQSLAEAARLAEQQRQAAANDPSRRSFSDADLADPEAACAREAMNFPLTMPLLREFAVTHTAMQRELEKDPALARRVVTVDKAPSCAELENAYRGAPGVSRILETRKTDLHDYLLTVKAFALAAVALKHDLPEQLRGAPTLAGNMRLIVANQEEIARLMEEPAAITKRVVEAVSKRTQDPSPAK